MNRSRSFLASVGLLGAILLGGGAVAGCQATPGPAGDLIEPVTTTTGFTAPPAAVEVTTTTATTTVTPVAPAPAPPAAPAAPAPRAAAPVPKAAPAPAPAQPAACGDGYYRNSDGKCVHRPVEAPAAPAGATAQCNDGTYSFSQHRQGTCSGHGGVARWL
jgi:hypothetical protein